MEKFAVDLDKVLDDFEFNEDCAEQIASVNPPSNSASSSASTCNLESVAAKNYSRLVIESDKSNKEFSITSLDKHRDPRQANQNVRNIVQEIYPGPSNSSCGKNELPQDTTDSVNHFYMRDCVLDNKLTQKHGVLAYDSEPASLTIHNDISPKFLQKQQNGSGSPKIDNRYDKKLSQLTSRPSVSNVFNSLNEYINAPSGSLDYVHTVLEEKNLGPNLKINNNNQIKNSISASNVTVNQPVLGKEIADTGSANIGHNDVNTERNIDRESVNLDYPNADVSKPPESVLESVNDNGNSENNNLGIQSVPSSDQADIQTRLPNLAVSDISVNEDTTHKPEIITVSTHPMPAQSICPVNDGENVTKGASYHETDDKQKYENVNQNLSKVFEEPENLSYENAQTKDASSDVLQKIVSEITSCENEIELPPQEIKISDETHNSDRTQKVFGFSNLDDLSEEELTKYLSELEEDEKRNKEVSKIETELRTLEEPSSSTLGTSKDEDEHEAPIFESVTIGELPTISQEELTEKAKKFPVIDYGKESKNEPIFSNIPEMLKSQDPRTDQAESASLVEENLSKEELSRQASVTENTESIVVDSSFQSQENNYASCEAETIAEAKPNVEDHSSYNTSIEEEGQISEIKSKEKETTNPVSYNPFDEVQSPSDSKSTSKENWIPQESSVEKEGMFSNIETVTKTMDPSINTNINEIIDESDKPTRPQTLDIVLPDSSNEPQATGSTSVTPSGQVQSDAEGPKEDCQGSSPDALDSSLDSNSVLGKQPPFWIPDSDASSCMLCDVKFTMLKRRHHCRACGKVLCNKCCNMKYKLEYQGNIDSRVCVPCYQLLTKAETEQGVGDWSSGYSTYMNNNEINSPQGRQPNPNNPMEYCSTIPPLQQLAGGLPPTPAVMVPVGVLKREGGAKHRPEGSKSVMFSDGIRPGCDLTELDMSWDLKPAYRKSHTKRITTASSSLANIASKRPNFPRIDSTTVCYVPQDPNALPPTVTIHKGQVSYHTVTDEELLYRTLKNKCEPPVMFAINRNLYAYVKITNLNCCVNKICWNVTSRGLACVGQDEVILLVETLPDETRVPKDLLIFINQLYVEAIKGNTVSELGFAMYQGGNLLGSREHAGFLFIRQTLQCLQKIVLPPAPFLVGLLVHRWETPWAKVFPFRLLLRLGAEYRYYPCPLVSVRFRDALYFEIGHTVMKVLADFRNYSYTLPSVRGLTIHLRNRMTDVMFPRNRYDQVIKGLNNSNDHVLAYASNFSIAADSHLVCIQTNTGDESSYQTQAINIHNKPRTVTGASFIVINGALKSSMGLSAKSSIVEDGLMVEIMPEKMEALKAALKNMQDFSIGCGRQGASEPDETVNIKWVDNDVLFNIGVKSPIDGRLMDGVPSIRVHNGTDYNGIGRFIRWTEVFIIKSDDHPTGVHDPVDINKLSGNIAKATCTALVKLLGLLATAGLTKLAVRTTIHPDNVGYEAGSEGTKLPPIYMNSLDNELIQVLHKAAQSSQDTHTVLELIFYVLDD